jgi:hypothetical protein
MHATMSEADREYAHNVGEMQRDRAWILSDRDVWYRNPYYKGPAEPHPEAAEDRPEVFATFREAASFARALMALAQRPVVVRRVNDSFFVEEA